MNELGKVGFDVIRLSGLTSVKKFDEPVVSHLIKEPKDVQKFLRYPNVSISKSHVLIRESGFDLKWGNTVKGTAYSYLVIHASDDGANLYNMSCSDVKDRIYTSLDTLYSKYFITFPMLDLDSLTVTYAEINRTIVTEYEFYQYHDFLQLIRWSAGGYNANFASYGKGGKSETEYIAKKSNYEIKAYDKKKELQSKLPINRLMIENMGNLFRLEITVKNECELKNFGSQTLFSKVTDESIESYFHAKIQKHMNKAFKHLEKLKTSFFYVESSTGSTEIIPLLGLFLKCVLEYGKNEKTGYCSFLHWVHYYESEILHHPYFLGIKELESLLYEHFHYLKQDDIRFCIKMLHESCNDMPHYDRYFSRSERIQEIVRKLIPNF